MRQVAQVTVEGVAVDLKPDGSFTFSRYVPLGGTQVTIEAVDEWGNKVQKVVRLSRKAVQTTAKVRDTTVSYTHLTLPTKRIV